VIEVNIDEEHRIANVVVPERMLSLAIGREGQNARLAAKLTGWRIDIRSDVSVAEAAKAEASDEPETAESTADVAATAESTAEDNATESLVVAMIGEEEPASAPATPASDEEAPKPKRRKSAKSTEPKDAGEVSP
jgi:N utilization substance protein A